MFFDFFLFLSLPGAPVRNASCWLRRGKPDRALGPLCEPRVAPGAEPEEPGAGDDSAGGRGVMGLGTEQLGGDDTELSELSGLRLDVDDPRDMGL